MLLLPGGVVVMDISVVDNVAVAGGVVVMDISVVDNVDVVAGVVVMDISVVDNVAAAAAVVVMDISVLNTSGVAHNFHKPVLHTRGLTHIPLTCFNSQVGYLTFHKPVLTHKWGGSHSTNLF